METIFKENDLSFHEDDDRIDAVSDVSSEDEVIYNKDYVKDYNSCKSNTSCYLSEIKSIIYGGTSSRFWLHRKYINSMDLKNLKDKEKMPFYAWECLTLQLEHRDVDLIIRKES